MAHRRSYLVTTFLCALALAGCVSLATAAAPRFVNFNGPGTTYDPSTVQVFGDGTTQHRNHSGDHIGGILLTAVGSSTSDGESDAPNARGFLPLVTLDPYPTLDPNGDVCGEDCDPVRQCTTNGPRIGRTPDAYPKRNGVWKRVKWSALGCTRDDPDTSPNFPIAKGITTYTVSKFVRVYRPAVDDTYWQGSDGYFNICLTTDNISDIVQKNGRLYCTVERTASVDRVSFRLKQSTRVTHVDPAYVCPGRVRAGDPPACN